MSMLLNFALLLSLSLAWASNYVFIAWVDDALPALTAGAAITLTAALFLMIGVRAVMRRPLWPIMRDRLAVPPLGVATAAIFAAGQVDTRHIFGVAVVVAGLWLVLRRHRAAPA